MLHRDPLTLSAESNGDPREARLSSQTNEERPIATPNKANLKSCLHFSLPYSPVSAFAPSSISPATKFNYGIMGP